MRLILISSLLISSVVQGQSDTLQLNLQEVDSTGKLVAKSSIPVSLASKLTISDSVTFATKAYRQKAVDSLNGLLSGKLATNGSGSALTGITDSTILSTRAYRQKAVDSINALLAGKLATNGNGSSLTGLTASQVGLGNVTNESKATMFTSPTFTGTPLVPGYVSRVASADIAATASATSTTTLFTPSANGIYRLTIYMKITTTGTSPVAGPVTITYQDADGSVAQSHVMLLQSVTGTVVTTTVNNSTTTGTVNGSMVFNAKSGVAITYAIAVSGTFGAGRYTAHIRLEQL